MSGERSNNDIFSGTPGDRAKMTGMPVRNTLKDDFGLDIPTELVPLPSGGKIYPEGSPLFGKETLEFHKAGQRMRANKRKIKSWTGMIRRSRIISFSSSRVILSD